MLISPNTLRFIRQQEGFRAQAYQCQAGKWTVGFGSTFINGKPVQPGQTITWEDAAIAMEKRVKSDAAWLFAHCELKLTDGQQTALLDFCYNFNTSVLAGSTLWHLLNEGKLQAAAAQFPLWCHYEDPETHHMLVSEGLLKRRNLEKELFLNAV